MTWSVSASGPRAEVHAKVKEQVKDHSRIAEAICTLVDCSGNGTHASVSGSGSETGAGNCSLSISTSTPKPV